MCIYSINQRIKKNFSTLLLPSKSHENTSSWQKYNPKQEPNKNLFSGP